MDLDEHYMRLALEEARKAALAEEVPIGAVLVQDEKVIAQAGNRTIGECDPTAHAEMVAIRAAARVLQNHRMGGTTLYVTIEPCSMCAGAMLQARITRLVYGADEPRGGAVRSCFEVLGHPKVNHQVQVSAGVLAGECAEILRTFFASRR